MTLSEGASANERSIINYYANDRSYELHELTTINNNINQNNCFAWCICSAIMFLPEKHVERSIPALRQLIKENPFAVLTTAIPSTTNKLIQSTQLPFVFDVEDDSSETELGVLRAHMARQNPQAKSMIESVTTSTASQPSTPAFLEQEVMVLFTAQANHYITTKFYKQTKPTTGKVVPTWNYASAQVYGKAKIYYDHKSEDTVMFLKQQLHALSENSERNIMGYTGENGAQKPWQFTDAPESYTSLLMKNIIGIEIVVETLEGKFKMSQEMQTADMEGVVEGLEAVRTEQAQRVADMVRCKNAAKLT
ncbi:putative transcriptional regulator [Sarocladium strictum]